MLNKEKYAKEIAEIACDGYKVAIVHGKPKSSWDSEPQGAAHKIIYS